MQTRLINLNKHLERHMIITLKSLKKPLKLYMPRILKRLNRLPESWQRISRIIGTVPRQHYKGYNNFNH